MQPYLETVGIITVAVFGIVLGGLFCRLWKKYWVIGYSAALLFIMLLAAGTFFDALNFIYPFDLLLAGRFRFVILALAITVGLISPIDQLPRKSERMLVCCVMSLILGWFCIMPFLGPAIVRGRLQTMPGYINAEGVCFQSTNYTCGPAAAVTVLRMLGLEADEGKLAILSHTSPMIGTMPRCLAYAINSEYGSLGVESSFRRFKSIEELKRFDFTLAVVKDSFLSDHCVAVLEVGDDYVIIADPVWGKGAFSYEQFSEIWRFSGVAIKSNFVQ
ncbi:MAG: cysteine peptidase family C39 domain-containing protein [Phycisphaerae bacterium]